jgi:hypothetical protein
MKQNRFRGTVSPIRPGTHPAALAGRLMGDSGWSLSARSGPLRFEDLWQAGGTLPGNVRRVVEGEQCFAGIEIVLGLAENHEGGASGKLPMLARAGNRLVALLAVDAGQVDAQSIDAHLIDMAGRAQRFCASAAILIVQSTDSQDRFRHFAAMAAAHGIPSARRNVLHLVDDASVTPLFAAWIEETGTLDAALK